MPGRSSLLIPGPLPPASAAAGTSAAVAGRLGIPEYAVEYPCRASHTGSYTDGLFGTVLLAGSAFHAVIAVDDLCFFVHYFKNIVGTYPGAHPASVAERGIEFKSYHIF